MFDKNLIKSEETINDNISKIEQLNRDKESSRHRNVVGTIYTDNTGEYVHYFKLLDTAEDLNFLNGLKLYARLQTDLDVKLFYFKATQEQFDHLDSLFKRDNFEFCKLIKSLEKSVSYIKI